MEDVRVRAARAADADAIAAMHLAAWRAAYPGIAPAWSSGAARRAPAKLAIAEIGGRPAGFCSFGPTRDGGTDVAEIYALYVDPVSWRRGAGRALCDHALAQAAERECRAMTLWVLQDNAGARAFYARIGFAPDGAERINTRLTGTPLHEVRYQKEIE